MKVKVLKKFNDLKERKVRNIGDVFEVTENRFKKINANLFGPLVIEVEGEDKKEMAKNE